jgi:hypothetical protein
LAAFFFGAATFGLQLFEFGSELVAFAIQARFLQVQVLQGALAMLMSESWSNR